MNDATVNARGIPVPASGCLISDEQMRVSTAETVKTKCRSRTFVSDGDPDVPFNVIVQTDDLVRTVRS